MKQPKPTKTIWITKEGELIPVRKMGDRHLVNTINMLRNSANARYEEALLAGYSMLGSLQGEMATFFMERDLAAFEDMDPIDYLAEELPIYDTMIKEAERRGLQVKSGYEREPLTPYMRRKAEKLIAEDNKRRNPL